MKLAHTFFAATTLSMLMATTAFGGSWKSGAEPNQTKWWYDNENGTYASNGWQWIDGDNDGVAESYYFDEEGWLLTNTTTPDGYQVNENGAWMENGIVQTQKKQAENIATGTGTSILEGRYKYIGGSTYLLNRNTGNYELYATTEDSSKRSWDKICPIEYELDLYFDITIIDERSVQVNYYNPEFPYFEYVTDNYYKVEDKWFWDSNKDGNIQENEKRSYIVWEPNGTMTDYHVVMESVPESEEGDPYSIKTLFGWPVGSTVLCGRQYSLVE